MIKKTNKFFFFIIILSNISVFAVSNRNNIKKQQVVDRVKHAEVYIRQHVKDLAINNFKKDARHIFAIDDKGNILLSPVHPETVGTNQINYKDPSGALAVLEEVKKAKAGGGWLKGRYRKNPKTGKFECRKIYIYPMPRDYFIGSWYYYPTNKLGQCPV